MGKDITEMDIEKSVDITRPVKGKSGFGEEIHNHSKKINKKANVTEDLVW